MSDSHLVRGTRHHGAGTPTSGHTHRRVDPTPRRHRRRVTTWARTLAAVVLLDPNAPFRDASRDADSAGGRPALTEPPSPAPPSTRALDAALDAAAALIVAGDTDAAFLLLALTQPAPHRPDHTQGTKHTWDPPPK